MDDLEITELYWTRSENAILETDIKYGRYCRRIAANILHDERDVEECVNDAYLRVWDSVPPERPERFSAFIGKITRNLALNAWERYSAEKRTADNVASALDELGECIPAPAENAEENIAINDALNRFLASLNSEKRIIFMRRYFYFDSVKDIAKDLSLGESKVKMSLLRSRNDLRRFLNEEDIVL